MATRQGIDRCHDEITFQVVKKNAPEGHQYSYFIYIIPYTFLPTFLFIMVRWSIWSIDKGRGGEFFKTGKGFKQDGLNRWDYERARAWFAEMGIIECRRRGWCGLMHWRVNFKRLYELVFAKKTTRAADAKKSKPTPREAKGKLTAIKLPEFVDAELFESHLRHCYEKHRSTNKETQCAKVKQLELARRKGHDIHAIQAQAVGGGWLNFYAPNNKSASAPEQAYLSPSPEEIHKIRMTAQAQEEERIRHAVPPEEARDRWEAIMAKLKKRHQLNSG